MSSRQDIREVLKIIDNKDDALTGEMTPSFDSMIRAEGISFRYSDEIPVIEDLYFTIQKNEKIALIGASGSGKSTLVKLLSGYYTTYTGEIYYDNIELREMNLHKLRHIVAFIQQNTIIFNESIRFNICMGESFSDEELHNALLVSGVDRFLKDIPQGWGMR